MSSVNKVILIGHLGADPEMKTMPSGVSIARLRIATTDAWKDKSTGQKQEKTEWHTVVCFDGLAGICERYLTKGKQVYIEGALSTRTWEDKDTGQKRYATEIKAREMKMLGSGGGSRGSADSASPKGEPEADDDVPF